MSRAYVGNSQVSIKIGSNVVSKIYIGSLLVYSADQPSPPPLETFDYVYKILNLIYITSIENSIYNLDYDLTTTSPSTIV